MEEAKLSPDEIMDEIDIFDTGEGIGVAETIEGFPPRIREAVEGLMFLGYLEDEFEFCGHHFVIRTLRGDEELLASLICKEFVGTLGQARAWVWAQIALAIVSVDGDEEFCPPTGPNKREYARARFQYCTSRWYWPTAAFINTRYEALWKLQEETIQRVEDLYKGNRPTFTPSADSSIDRGVSEGQDPSEPQEDIRDHLDLRDSTDSNSDS